MKRSDIGAGIVLALAATWALLWLIPSQTSPAQSETTMSPAMMPSVAAGIVLVLSLLLAAYQFLTKTSEISAPHEEFGSETRGFGRADAIELGIWSAVAVLALGAMVNVSFVVASAVVLFASMLWMGQRNVWALVAVAAGVPLVISVAARHLFGVEMP